MNEIGSLKNELNKVENKRTEIVTENRELVLLKRVSESEAKVHRLTDEAKETERVVSILIAEKHRKASILLY